MKLNRLAARMPRMGALRKYATYFSDTDFRGKLRKVSHKLGHKVTYMLLVLYYAIGEVPMKDKMLVAGVLGYFILPADLVPDFLPGGFVDDVAALTAVYRAVRKGISPEAEARARRKAQDWFGSSDMGDSTDDAKLDSACDYCKPL